MVQSWFFVQVGKRSEDFIPIDVHGAEFKGVELQLSSIY